MTTIKTTPERLVNSCHTCSQRPATHDPKAQRALFRVLRRSLYDVLPASQSAIILDAGCGEGWLLCFLRSAGYRHLPGFDLSPENVDVCHARDLTFVKRFDALLFDTFSYEALDAVLALNLIERLPKQKVASFLEQILHTLKPGGSIVIQTPHMGSLLGWYARYNDLTHESGLTENSARSLLAVAGFPPNGTQVLPRMTGTSWKGRGSRSIPVPPALDTVSDRRSRTTATIDEESHHMRQQECLTGGNPVT